MQECNVVQLLSAVPVSTASSSAALAMTIHVLGSLSSRQPTLEHGLKVALSWANRWSSNVLRQ